MPEGHTGGDRSSAPDIMGGPSGATLVLRGFCYELAAFLCGSLAIAESRLPGAWYVWGAGIFAVVIVLLSIGLIQTLRGYRKLNEEKRRGYTTAKGEAIKDPALYLVDRKRLRVVAGPYEPRDRTSPRRDG